MISYGTRVTWQVVGISWNESPQSTFKIKAGKLKDRKKTEGFDETEIDIRYS
jgi:hypothetical protein